MSIKIVFDQETRATIYMMYSKIQFMHTFVYAKHVPGKQNIITVLLSRLQIHVHIF